MKNGTFPLEAIYMSVATRIRAEAHAAKQTPDTSSTTICCYVNDMIDYCLKGNFRVSEYSQPAAIRKVRRLVASI